MNAATVKFAEASHAVNKQSKLHSPVVNDAVRDVFVVGTLSNALHLLMKPLKRVAPNAPHRPKIECINGNVLQHVRLRLKEASILRDLQQKWTAKLVTYTVRVTEQVTERVTEHVKARVTEPVT